MSYRALLFARSSEHHPLKSVLSRSCLAGTHQEQQRLKACTHPAGVEVGEVSVFLCWRLWKCRCWTSASSFCLIVGLLCVSGGTFTLNLKEKKPPITLLCEKHKTDFFFFFFTGFKAAKIGVALPVKTSGRSLVLTWP